MKFPVRFLVTLSILCLLAPALQAKKSAQQGSSKGVFDAPAISCAAGSSGASIDVTITAGASGAPAGFSVQWVLLSELDANGGQWPENQGDAASYCEASFSGNANGHAFELDPGESVTINIGDSLYDLAGASSDCENSALQCGEQYVFRTFAHATSSKKRSAWSPLTYCSTMNCGGGGGGDVTGCTYTQSYWRDNGVTSEWGNIWPVTSLTLGAETYTDLELLAILNTPGGTNGLIALAHQLITAKLNVANGAGDPFIDTIIASADTLIGSMVVPPVGIDSLSTSAVSSLVTALQRFNEGATGPGHCE